jgi:hypothetical protein
VEKGAIPIETIAILVIVMIVLIVLIAFFMGVFGPGRASIELQRKFYSECSKWTAAGCVGSIDPNLIKACGDWQDINEAKEGTLPDKGTCSEDWIRDTCGCPKKY